MRPEAERVRPAACARRRKWLRHWLWANGRARAAGSVDGPVPVSPPVAGTLPGCPDKDALTSFEKIGDGLGFAPGGAPMAGPTTQVKPSKWRPR